MADVRLHRADRAVAVAVGRLPEGLRQRGDFDRVADRRAGAVAFDVADRVGRHVRHGQRFGHGRGLSVDARREVADLARAVVIHGRTSDDRINPIAVAQRIFQPAQHGDAGPAAENRAARAMIEGPAMSVGRKNLVLLKEVALSVRQFDRRAAGQRHIALAAQQALASRVNGDERRRAGGLHVDARTLQVEAIRHARREKVFVVAGVPQQEHADRFDELRIREQVLLEIGPHAATGEDADPAVELLRRMAGAFQRLPRTFQKVAMLRVHDRRFLRAEPEEFGVEHRQVVEHGRRLHVVRMFEQFGGDAGRREIGIRELPHRFDAVAQVLPELARRIGARHA